jgi:glutamine cyclotransferase
VLGIVVLFGLGIGICLVVCLASDARRVGYAHHFDGLSENHRSSPSDGNETPVRADVLHYRYKVVKSYPHDWRSFTQGLVYEDGFIYEGTGLYGQSAIFQRDLQTGKAAKTLRLSDKYFGEGIALVGDKLIQLTWQSNVGFVYKKDTFTPLGQFKYAGEGWGLTYDGKRLILSDGTSTLRFLDPNTYAETGRIKVRDQGRPVPYINELEFIADGPHVAQPPPAVKSEESPPRAGVPQAEVPDGLVYANIWRTDQIVIIDPKTGRVTGRIDLSGLYTPPVDDEGDRVLNGIAYFLKTKHLLVTGKLWHRMYEIELVPEPPHQPKR